MSIDPNTLEHPPEPDEAGPRDTGTPPTKETFPAGTEPGTIHPDLADHYNALFGAK